MPVLVVVLLVYNGFVSLQVTLFGPEATVVAVTAIGVATAVGLVAALGGPVIRLVLMAVSLAVWFDVTTMLPAAVVERWSASLDSPRRRDEQRLRDIETIAAALDDYARRTGSLPMPLNYGEGTGPAGFWQGWWDVSAVDEDGDGRSFLPFLESVDGLTRVPVDPRNEPSPDGMPTEGWQYVYFLVPPNYTYNGGACEANRDAYIYMLGVTAFEELALSDDLLDPLCDCLWQEQPGFFRDRFAHTRCGVYRP